MEGSGCSPQQKASRGQSISQVSMHLFFFFFFFFFFSRATAKPFPIRTKTRPSVNYVLKNKKWEDFFFFLRACSPAHELMSRLNSRPRFMLILARLHRLHIALYVPGDQTTAAGPRGSDYRNRQSAMQFILDRHYPRIASSELESAVCVVRFVLKRKT